MEMRFKREMEKLPWIFVTIDFVGEQRDVISLLVLTSFP